MTREIIQDDVNDFLEGTTREDFEVEDNLDVDDDTFFGREAEEASDDAGDDDAPSEKTDAGDGEDNDSSDTDGTDNSETPEDTPTTPVDVEDPPAEETPDELATLREQNQKLIEAIETLQGGTSTETPAGETPDGEGDKTPTEVADFVGEEDLDDILSSKDKFNEFLSGVINQTRQQTVEQVYRSVPQMVQHQVEQQQTITTYVNEFYKANEDLLPVRKTVSGVANIVASEHPEFSLDKIFEESEKRVRNMLGLKKGAASVQDDDDQQEPSQSPSRKPALPQGKGGSRSGAAEIKLTGQDKHIADVL